MATQKNINVSAEFSVETKDPRTDIVTVWFRVYVTGFECTDLYVGLSKKGDWLSASGSFYDLSVESRNKALTEARSLLSKMSV